jgi:serine/threonine protein kinase
MYGAMGDDAGAGEIERAIGSEFAGYRLERLLGRGGIGVVYRATHADSGSPVALKLLRPDVASDPLFRARFVREARLSGELRHPHIVPVVEAGEREDVLYLAMQFIDGVDLAGLIAERGSLHPGLLAELVRQVAAALDSAAERGLVHRDVKPANVLIESREDRPHAYLADFGVSKYASSQSGLTATGVWVGSIDYAAPEQLQSQLVDHRADVYALGCLLYEGLTAQVPFPRARDVDKLIAHLADAPPRPSKVQAAVPAGFDDVVGRALAKLPEERFSSAGELAQAALTAAEPAGLAPSWSGQLPSGSALSVDRGAPTAG